MDEQKYLYVLFSATPTIGAVANRLSAYHIYTGDFPENQGRDTSFFHPHPVTHPIAASARDLLRLFWRRHFQQRY